MGSLPPEQNQGLLISKKRALNTGQATCQRARNLTHNVPRGGTILRQALCQCPQAANLLPLRMSGTCLRQQNRATVKRCCRRNGGPKSGDFEFLSRDAHPRWAWLNQVKALHRRTGGVPELRDPPCWLDEVDNSCAGSPYGKSLQGDSRNFRLAPESCLHPTASKKPGLSVLHPPGNRFCQPPEWGYEQILPQVSLEVKMPSGRHPDCSFVRTWANCWLTLSPSTRSYVWVVSCCQDCRNLLASNR